MSKEFKDSTLAIVSIVEASQILNLSIPTIHRLVKRGEFADKIQLSQNRVGFMLKDLQRWVEDRRKAVAV